MRFSSLTLFYRGQGGCGEGDQVVGVLVSECKGGKEKWGKYITGAHIKYAKGLSVI